MIIGKSFAPGDAKPDIYRTLAYSISLSLASSWCDGNTHNARVNTDIENTLKPVWPRVARSTSRSLYARYSFSSQTGFQVASSLVFFTVKERPSLRKVGVGSVSANLPLTNW